MLFPFRNLLEPGALLQSASALRINVKVDLTSAKKRFDANSSYLPVVSGNSNASVPAMGAASHEHNVVVLAKVGSRLSRSMNKCIQSVNASHGCSCRII